MEQVILYTLPAAPDATEHKVLRLTIGTVTALGMARRSRLQRDLAVWLREQHGIDSGSDERLTEEQGLLFDVCYRRCYMLAALKRVESGVCPPDADAPTEWKPDKLPEAWETIEGFIDGDLPGSLFNEWDFAAQATNPDTFFVSITDEKKRKPGSALAI